MRSPADNIVARRPDRQDPTGHRPHTDRKAAERGWRMRTTGRGGGPRNRRSRLATRPLQP